MLVSVDGALDVTIGDESKVDGYLVYLVQPAHFSLDMKHVISTRWLANPN